MAELLLELLSEEIPARMQESIFNLLSLEGRVEEVGPKGEADSVRV